MNEQRQDAPPVNRHVALTLTPHGALECFSKRSDGFLNATARNTYITTDVTRHHRSGGCIVDDPGYLDWRKALREITAANVRNVRTGNGR